MENYSNEVATGTLQGQYQKEFESVVQAFKDNFDSRGELGASICVKLHGETVLDLWGGSADQQVGKPWDRDTVCVVFSSTKGATALCAHILAHQNKLDLNGLVTDIWPEYGAEGKENTRVYMMLNHSSGVPVTRAQLETGDFCDWDKMCGYLAEQAPFWEPGSTHGYHGFTFGWTVGELVRRISGKSLGTFFQDEVAGPLGIDFWIGLPEEMEERVAPMMLWNPEDAPVSKMQQRVTQDPNSLSAQFMLNNAGFFPDNIDSRETHAAEIGAGNGITNGRGLAGMYAPLACGGRLGNIEFCDADGLARMTEVSTASGEDEVLLETSKFSLGFMKSVDSRHLPTGKHACCIMGKSAFGHAGAGGSIGFADPECGLSFGYTMNQMGYGVYLNERGQSLIDTTYRALGYRSNRSGYWIK